MSCPQMNPGRRLWSSSSCCVWKEAADKWMRDYEQKSEKGFLSNPIFALSRKWLAVCAHHPWLLVNAALWRHYCHRASLVQRFRGSTHRINPTAIISRWWWLEWSAWDNLTNSFRWRLSINHLRCMDQRRDEMVKCNYLKLRDTQRPRSRHNWQILLQVYLVQAATLNKCTAAI